MIEQGSKTSSIWEINLCFAAYHTNNKGKVSLKCCPASFVFPFISCKYPALYPTNLMDISATTNISGVNFDASRCIFEISNEYSY